MTARTHSSVNKENLKICLCLRLADCGSGVGGATQLLARDGGAKESCMTQQSGHASTSGWRSNMEVVPKTTHWRGSRTDNSEGGELNPADQIVGPLWVEPPLGGEAGTAPPQRGGI